ncbi:hypothetical protein [Alteraurantiacibacter aquimixticola]|uniref:Lipoprotein n=1 Tax=Alteraurantiacibacter aquimixticola TaxID=2489173 RepID=A0A4T3F0L5_9SPHN|nr:hypothetical protein [Alteraurantiacibacter aquimixticola]TIX50474.1 hypothetical protein E5222_09375 [Alteraurantiacibacter aquimixticola]
MRREWMAAMAGSMVLAACVAPAPSPTPDASATRAPVAAPAPSPTPTPSASIAIPPAAHADWHQAPVTPGDWFYVAEPAETLAVFGPSSGEALMLLRCDLRTRRVGIARFDNVPGEVPLRIETETMTRDLTASPLPNRNDLLVAELSARDPLLEAMAFSRGRLGVHFGGNARLYVPAWPEITRVVEDCR